MFFNTQTFANQWRHSNVYRHTESCQVATFCTKSVDNNSNLWAYNVVLLPNCYDKAWCSERYSRQRFLCSVPLCDMSSKSYSKGIAQYYMELFLCIQVLLYPWEMWYMYLKKGNYGCVFSKWAMLKIRYIFIIINNQHVFTLCAVNLAHRWSFVSWVLGCERKSTHCWETKKKYMIWIYKMIFSANAHLIQTWNRTTTS